MITIGTMPRNNVTKDELTTRVLKIKNELYNGMHYGKGGEWHDGAHDALNKVLDILKEYRA